MALPCESMLKVLEFCVRHSFRPVHFSKIQQHLTTPDRWKVERMAFIHFRSQNTVFESLRGNYQITKVTVDLGFYDDC